VTGYNNGKGGVVSILADTEITATFNADGQVNGKAGCNNYFADYSVDGTEITVGPAGVTRKFCAAPEGIMDQEAEFLAALASAGSYEIQGDRLDLYRDDGARAMTLVARSQTVVELSPETLANLAYQSEWVDGGMAQLVGGELRQPVAPGSATETLIQITDAMAFGQLPDGRDAAAVVIITSPGGSGTFYDLALVAEEDGTLQNVASAFLGDRPLIDAIAFEGDSIIAQMVVHGPDDPMCCPTQQVQVTFGLVNGELVETDREVVGQLSTEPIDSPLAGTAWLWTETLYNNDTTVVPLDPDKYMLVFSPDGRIGIQADCNGGYGVYTDNKGSLRLEPTLMTMAVCEGESDGATFVRDLRAAGPYLLEGDTLVIDLFADSGHMHFTRR
jgi:heat shock protein HslJ